MYNVRNFNIFILAQMWKYYMKIHYIDRSGVYMNTAARLIIFTSNAQKNQFPT